MSAGEGSRGDGAAAMAAAPSVVVIMVLDMGAVRSHVGRDEGDPLEVAAADPVRETGVLLTQEHGLV